MSLCSSWQEKHGIYGGFFNQLFYSWDWGSISGGREMNYETPVKDGPINVTACVEHFCDKREKNGCCS
jgi:hypothetical protein